MAEVEASGTVNIAQKKDNIFDGYMNISNPNYDCLASALLRIKITLGSLNVIHAGSRCWFEAMYSRCVESTHALMFLHIWRGRRQHRRPSIGKDPSPV
jgi:hypothetical protein